MSRQERILTIEEEKAAEFGKRLDVEVTDRLPNASAGDDELQAAFADVAAAYIVQDGGIPEFIPCSINEKVGRNRVTVRGYANTQNPIKAADLQSNIKFHRQMEELSENVWCPDGDSRWFYERARGAYESPCVILLSIRSWISIR